MARQLEKQCFGLWKEEENTEDIIDMIGGFEVYGDLTLGTISSVDIFCETDWINGVLTEVDVFRVNVGGQVEKP